MSKEIRKHLEKIFNKIDSIAKKGKDNVFEYYKYIDELVSKGEYSYFEQALYYYYKIDISNYIDVSAVKRKTWKPILFETSSSFSTKLKRLYDDRKVYQIGFDIYSDDISRLQISLSNPLSSTFSSISSTQSVSITRTDDIIYFNTDDDIYRIEISQASWSFVPGSTSSYQRPTIIKEVDQILVTQSSTRTQIPTSYVADYLLSVYVRPPFGPCGGGGGATSVTNYKISLKNSRFLGQIKEVDAYPTNSKYLIENKEFSKLMGSKRINLDVYKNTSLTEITMNVDSLSFDQNLLIRYSMAIDILLGLEFVIMNGYWNDIGVWIDSEIWLD